MHLLSVCAFLLSYACVLFPNFLSITFVNVVASRTSFLKAYLSNNPLGLQSTREKHHLNEPVTTFYMKQNDSYRKQIQDTAINRRCHN